MVVCWSALSACIGSSAVCWPDNVPISAESAGMSPYRYTEMEIISISEQSDFQNTHKNVILMTELTRRFCKTYEKV